MEDRDHRGVRRGSCVFCDCESYKGGSDNKKCANISCGHSPGQHVNLDNPIVDFPSAAIPPSSTLGLKSMSSPNLGLVSYVNGGSSDCSVASAGFPSLSLSGASRSSFVPDELRCIYPKCHRKRYSEDGRIHPFCGRNHARQYQLEQRMLADTNDKCTTPGCNKFKFKDEDGKMYDFCSIYCRDHQPNEGLVMICPEECGICQLTGCNAYKYQDPANGRIHPFCSRSHAFEAKQRGISVPDSNSTIQRVDLKSSEGNLILGKFQSTWAKGKCPPVSYIFSVANGYLKATWLTYQKSLEDKTLEEHFHGTKLECDITKQSTLCSNNECGICGITNTGFDRRCIRKNINFQRFGHGFYVAPNSSKCHDYTQGKYGYRAMILLDVCPGKKYELKTDDEKLKQPPRGYNSVHGKAGLSLNFDELVLYNPDGALPRYIIVYKHDGEHKIAK